MKYDTIDMVFMKNHQIKLVKNELNNYFVIKCTNRNQSVLFFNENYHKALNFYEKKIGV